MLIAAYSPTVFGMNGGFSSKEHLSGANINSESAKNPKIKAYY